MANWFICVLGVLTVFIGLVCLVFICQIMSAICSKFGENSQPETNQTAPAVSNDSPIENKEEIIAGVCAAIAEEIGTDVSNIKVTSFKRA